MVKPRTSAFPLASKSSPVKFFCLLAVLSLFMTFAVQAATRFDVWLGYGSDFVVPEASWFPVVCEVMNDGPTFVGVIEVSSGQFGGSQERRTVVELPTGTLKRIVIPVFSSARYQSQWTVRLLDERGRVHAEQSGLTPKKQTTAGATVVGAIPRTANGVPVIRQILARGQQIEPVTVRLPPAILPDNPLVLEGMDTIYLNSEKAPELNVGQVNALLAWLNAGGHLVVGVEQISDVNATPWLRAIVPCDLTGMATVPIHGELQQWVRTGPSAGEARLRSRGQPRTSRTNPFTDLADDAAFEKGELQVATGALRKGEAMVSAGDTPLIVTSHEGRGRVTTMLFSPEREPFHSWKNLPSFWAKLAGVAADLYTNENFYAPGGWSIDGVFGAMIDSKQIRKLPVEWLLLLLIAYLVVIGPLDQYWLKRIRRPMLTWITFPCYVVMFSLLIYFIGYKLRAGDTEWNELHLVDVLPNGENHAELRGRTYASIYSPVNATYRVESQQLFSAFRGEFQSSWNGGGGAGTERAEVCQNGDNFKADIFVPVWTSQLYESDWWQSAPLPLSFTVDSEGSKWSVKVSNHCDKPFTNARLFIGGRVVDLGELPPGTDTTRKFEKEQGQALSDFVRTYASNFQQASQQRMSAFGASGGGRILDVANGAMAASFASRLGPEQVGGYEFLSPPGLDLYSVMEQGNAILLAWEPDYSPTKPMNQFPTRRGHRDTLWRMSIPINVSSTP